MIWFWLALCPLLLVVLAVLAAHFYIMVFYVPHLLRIFQEKPLFIIPRGQPIEPAETIRFPTTNGLTLCGSYLPAPAPRKGVIIFGLEFGANRWSCVPYCQYLLERGFDIFTFEVRGQGESDCQPGYEPLQWVTDYEVDDYRAALAYVKSRPDADPRGVGFFGISKGATPGLIVAADDPYVRCFVTDGMFDTFTTMVPYMKKWIVIYCRSELFAAALPRWYYRHAARVGLRQIEKQRGCHFSHLERVIGRLAPRPLLMIHGGGDTYIKTVMARALFDLASPPKEFWLVEKAKHNQALQEAGDAYKRRVLAFFEEHLASRPAQPMTSTAVNGVAAESQLKGENQLA